jgi:hypothetical protein
MPDETIRLTVIIQLDRRAWIEQNNDTVDTVAGDVASYVRTTLSDSPALEDANARVQVIPPRGARRRKIA